MFVKSIKFIKRYAHLTIDILSFYKKNFDKETRIINNNLDYWKELKVFRVNYNQINSRV